MTAGGISARSPFKAPQFGPGFHVTAPGNFPYWRQEFSSGIYMIIPLLLVSYATYTAIIDLSDVKAVKSKQKIRDSEEVHHA
jgi:hypothetical protein